MPVRHDPGGLIMRNLKSILTQNKKLFGIFQRFGSYSPFPLYPGSHTTPNCGCI